VRDDATIIGAVEAPEPDGRATAGEAAAPGRAWPLFDEVFYLAQRPDVAAAGIDPATHYDEHGWAEGVQPHPLFDGGYYLAQRPDLQAAKVNPLLHYLEHGATEAGDPHPLFFTAYYRGQTPVPAGIAPLVHYLSEGRRRRLKPHPLFDPDYYLKQRADVRGADLDPLTHYVARGWKEGARPHPLFDPACYRAQLPPDVAADRNPLTHYLQHGWRDGIRPHPLFDPEYYLARLPDARAADFNPLTHYLEHGWREGGQPHALFDPDYYLSQFPSGDAQGLNPLAHYVEHGWREGRRPHPLFDPEYYMAQLPQLRAAGLDPLIHYIEHGWKAEADPHLLFYTSFYLGQSSPTAGLAPLIHYLTEGWQRGLAPHPLFDPDHFLRRAPAVASERQPPLSRYASSDWEAALDPHPLFEASYYLSQQPKRGAFRTPLEHYLKAGWQDGFSPHPLFDTAFYLASSPDLQGTGVHPLVHFVMHGRREGRRGTLADVPRMVQRLLDAGQLDRAAALHGAFAPTPVGAARQTLCLPIADLHEYATKHRLIVQEFAAETIDVPRPTILGDDRDDLKSGPLACPPAFVCCMEDAVIVGGTRIAICADGVLLHEEVARNRRDPELSIKPAHVIARVKDDWALATLERRPNDRIREGVLLSCDHDPNYFHWLVEVLPKLAMVDEVEALRHVPLLIRDGLHPNLLRALDLANTHGRRIIQLRTGCAYRVGRLVYPSDLCRTVDRYKGRTSFASDCILAPYWLRMVTDRIIRGLALDGVRADRRLFLTRHEGLRQISNIQELEFRFAARGYDVETFQQVSFDYQVLRSRQAGVMLGATGAAVTNMAFCRPGSDVIVMMSAHRGQNPYVWQQLATAFGHRLKLVAGERLYARAEYELHDDYRIDLNLLEAALPGRAAFGAASGMHTILPARRAIGARR